MGPTVEQKIAPTQNQQREDRGFEHIAAPALHHGFEMLTLGSAELAAWKILFKIAPNIFKKMGVAGVDLPNRQTVFAMAAAAGMKDLLERGGPNLRAA